MADGPTIVNNTRGSGTIIAVIAAIILLVVVLFLTGVFDFGANPGGDVNVNVDAPAVEAPAAPAAPAPATPAPAAPAAPAN